MYWEPLCVWPVTVAVAGLGGGVGGLGAGCEAPAPPEPPGGQPPLRDVGARPEVLHPLGPAPACRPAAVGASGGARDRGHSWAFRVTIVHLKSAQIKDNIIIIMSWFKTCIFGLSYHKVFPDVGNVGASFKRHVWVDIPWILASWTQNDHCIALSGKYMCHLCASSAAHPDMFPSCGLHPPHKTGQSCSGKWGASCKG